MIVMCVYVYVSVGVYERFHSVSPYGSTVLTFLQLSPLPLILNLI